jgi:ribosomal protein S10
LTFLFQPEGQPAALIDYAEKHWSPHPCHTARKDLLDNNRHLQKLAALKPPIEKIPFVHQERTTDPKTPRLNVGIVLTVTREDEQKVRLSVLTPDNTILEIKTTAPAGGIHPASLISLNNAIRIGRGRFRLDTLQPVRLPKTLTPQEHHAGTTVQILLSASDQEQLETCLKRLLNIGMKAKSLPSRITVRPVESNGNEQIFSRQLDLPITPEVLLSIEKTSLPESVQIQVRQGPADSG